MAELLQRIPPHNNEADQSVLGSMLIDAESVSEASGSLKGEDFYSDAHKEIFEAMLDIYEQGRTGGSGCPYRGIETERNSRRCWRGILYIGSVHDSAQYCKCKVLYTDCGGGNPS